MLLQRRIRTIVPVDFQVFENKNYAQTRKIKKISPFYTPETTNVIRKSIVFISYRTSAANGFLKWSRSQAQKNSNDNDQPGGSTPVSLADPLSSNPDASMGLERTGSA